MEFFAKEESDDEDYYGGMSSGDGDDSVPFVEWTFVSGDELATMASRGVSR